MPALNDVLRKDSPEGYGPSNPPLSLPAPVTLPGQDNSFKVTPTIRCPIPPTSAGPDTLRQFNDGNSLVPHRRVLPLPTNNGVSTGSTITNTTVISSSSSGAAPATSLTAKNAVVATTVLGAGVSSYQTVNMSSKSFQLISCKANVACGIRMYGSAVAMAIDASRPLDAPLAAELQNNLVTDIVLDTAPFTWNWQNRVGANSDTPQTTSLYIAVTNIGAGPTPISVTLTFLPLESL